MHSDSVNVIAGSAYSSDFIAIKFRLIHASFLFTCPVLMYSPSLFIFFFRYFFCLLLFPSGARNTPNIFFDFSGFKTFSCTFFSSLSFVLIFISFCFLTSLYCQIAFFQSNDTTHVKLLLGSNAPPVVFATFSHSFSVCCICLVASFGSFLPSVNANKSVSSTKANPHSSISSSDIGHIISDALPLSCSTLNIFVLTAFQI